MRVTIQSKKFFLILVLFNFTNLYCAEQNILLKNIYHHRGASTVHDNTPELGSVAFYFSGKPVIQCVGSELLPGHIVKKTYTIKGAQLQKEKPPALPIVSKHYGVTAHTVGDALHLVVTYDARKVAIEFNMFDSISLQKGVIIHFLNRKSCVQQIVAQDKKNRKRKIVVIDSGHGGTDPGAIGCFGIKEKDIALSVGLQVAQLLKKAGIHVVLTRSCDISLTLDERTSYANTHTADLFVSIHANYAQNASAQGIETFYMQPSLLRSESSLSGGGCSSMLHEQLKVRVLQSDNLARLVHQSVIKNVQNEYPTVVDRKVKHAVAQILLGSHMPAILIELGFISHKKEAQLLQDRGYQGLLARSISSGVMAYLKE